ncbi:MAG TPA: PilZ domain-containing protein [Clostridia bacterium]|nr:PilZ domain-containing protein [Clostridia bacterium]
MPERKTYLQELVGNLCEIKTEQNDLLVVARVESIDPEDDTRMTIVSAQEDERLPLLGYNTPVKIISFASKQGFLLMRGSVYISTTSMLTLVNVHTAQGYERRKYFRLNTNTMATAVLQHENVNPEDPEEEAMTLVLYDISLGGIRIGSNRVLNPGDLLLTTFQLMDKKMEFCCRVCREITARRAVPRQKQYGCEFVSFSTRQIDHLCNILFKLQRIEIQNRKKNRYD